MNTKINALLFLLVFFLVPAAAQSDQKVTIGTIDTVKSSILNEDRKVWVYMPNSGPGSVYSKQRYPVVYLLDGDWHFDSVVGMVRQFSSVNANTLCPEMIVVGIPNTDRIRDLTPTRVDTDAFKTSGGGDKFMSFIEKELIPYIDDRYPTNPYRTFIGHSLGGLMVMDALVNRPHLFNSYIAIDPSMWWDKKALLEKSKKALAERSFADKSLYLGIANTMNGMDEAAVRKDTTDLTGHVRSILELDDLLKANSKNQLRFRSKLYLDDSHGSVPLISEYDGLRFIFDFYQLKFGIAEYSKITKDVIDRAKKHFVSVSERFGYKVNIPEQFANELGYAALGQKQYSEAEELFKMNVANYPQSQNVYDSLGDLYDAKGEKDLAIQNYRKALTITEVEATRKKLEKMLNEK